MRRGRPVVARAGMQSAELRVCDAIVNDKMKLFIQKPLFEERGPPLVYLPTLINPQAS